MKEFDEKHEAIIDVWFKPQVDNAKNGEIIPHRKSVSTIQIYQRKFINEQEVFLKFEFTRDMIMHFSDKIKDIESQTVEMPFDNLPF